MIRKRAGPARTNLAAPLAVLARRHKDPCRRQVGAGGADEHEPDSGGRADSFDDGRMWRPRVPPRFISDRNRSLYLATCAPRATEYRLARIASHRLSRTSIFSHGTTSQQRSRMLARSCVTANLRPHAGTQTSFRGWASATGWSAACIGWDRWRRRRSGLLRARLQGAMRRRGAGSGFPRAIPKRIDNCLRRELYYVGAAYCTAIGVDGRDSAHEGEPGHRHRRG
jgi:hypothetical protein